MADGTLTAHEEARLIDLAQQGQALLKSGVSEQELARKYEATGMSSDSAEAIVKIARNIEAREKKTARKTWGLTLAVLILGPMLLIGGGVVISNALKSPNYFGLTTAAAQQACEATNGRRIEVASLNGENVLFVGSSNLPGAVERGQEGIGQFFDDEDLLVDKAVCISSDTGEEVVCDGYYSEPVLEALAATGSIEGAYEALDRNDPNYFNYANELSGNGRSETFQGLELTAKLVSIDSGFVYDTNTHVRSPECPDSYYDGGWSPNPGRASVSDEDTAAVLAGLSAA